MGDELFVVVFEAVVFVFAGDVFLEDQVEIDAQLQFVYDVAALYQLVQQLEGLSLEMPIFVACHDETVVFAQQFN